MSNQKTQNDPYIITPADRIICNTLGVTPKEYKESISKLDQETVEHIEGLLLSYFDDEVELGIKLYNRI